MIEPNRIAVDGVPPGFTYVVVEVRGSFPLRPDKGPGESFGLGLEMAFKGMVDRWVAEMLARDP